MWQLTLDLNSLNSSIMTENRQISQYRCEFKSHSSSFSLLQLHFYHLIISSFALKIRCRNMFTIKQWMPKIYVTYHEKQSSYPVRQVSLRGQHCLLKGHSVEGLGLQHLSLVGLKWWASGSLVMSHQASRVML